MPKKAVRPMPYAVSEHTKAMLCQALKKKMVQKPLDKITIRELAEGGCKLSVRTSGGLNASRVCALLGGGGHAAAAGCTIPGTVAEAKTAILGAIRKVQADA